MIMHICDLVICVVVSAVCVWIRVDTGIVHVYRRHL